MFQLDTNKINLFMARCELSKAELAKEMGITEQGLCLLMKKGYCKPKTAGKLARALNVDVTEIIKN